MTLTDEQELNVDIIGLVVGSVSLACSIFTLVLIYFTRKWNGYLLLLTSMTVCQILYDLNYMLRFFRSATICYITQFFDLVGGLGVSFWTNTLAFVIAYTVVLSQSINIFELYPYFSIYASGIPLTIGFLAVFLPDVIDHSDDGPYGSCYYHRTPAGDFIYDFYYYARIISVAVTILLCSLTFSRIKKMAINSSPQHNSKDTSDSNNESRAILRTVKKMNFYAFAQIICRSGAAWNEFYFGKYSNYESNIMAAICSPSSGIFNFLIFLFMQPNAFRNFKYLMICRIPPKPRMDSLDPTKEKENTKRDFIFRDKFISQADYDHHGIINSLHQNNNLGTLHSYFENENVSLSTRPTTTGNSFIELHRSTTIGSNMPRPLQTPMTSPGSVELAQGIHSDQALSPNSVRPGSTHSAYDFFDEDYDESGGFSNSFANRRSTWGVRDSGSSSVDGYRNSVEIGTLSESLSAPDSSANGSRKSGMENIDELSERDSEG